MSEERYQESVAISPRKLTREDLERLIDLATADLGPDHGFEILVRVNNTEIRLKSLDQLMAHDSVPGVLEDFAFHTWMPRRYANVRQIEKGVDFSIGPLGARMSVDGIDETWVAGMAKRFQGFFAMRRSFRVPLQSMLGNSIVMSLVVGLWFVVAVLAVSSLPMGYAVAFSVSSTYLITSYVSWSRRPRLGGVKIALRERSWELLGMSLKDLVFLALAVLGVILSALQLGGAVNR